MRNQKRSLEAGLIPEASREFTSLLAEIRNVEAEIAGPEYENQLAAYQNMRTQVKGLIDNTQTQKKDLDEKLANGKRCCLTTALQTGHPWMPCLPTRRGFTANIIL